MNIRLSKKRKGFTLIELLVVIAIIGILASIVLVALNSARVKARDARRKADMHGISLAMEMYYDANASSYVMDPDWDDAFAATCSGAIATASETFLETIPSDPGSKTYFCSDAGDTTGQTYCAWGQKEEGGETAGWIVSNKNGTKEVDNGSEPSDLDSCNQ